MGTLKVVMGDKVRCDLPGLLQVSRPVDGQALLLIGAVVAFDKGILLGVVRSTDLDLNAQTGSKAHQGRGKITALRAAYPAHIPIQGDLLGTPVCGQGLGESLQSRLGRAHRSAHGHRGAPRCPHR